VTKIEPHPLTMDGKDTTNLRGDSISQERYYDPDFMKQEWQYLWTRIWHIAGREQQLQVAGDYIVHDFMRESVMIVRQRDGSLKGFYNACGHRAARLVWGNSSQDSFFCPYHGWRWGLSGVLEACPDQDDFPQGDPVGKATLVEVRVGTWAGLVWYTMDDDAPDLLKYLEPTPELYKGHQFEKTVRVHWIRVELDANWKFWSDNFNESYHTRTVHPQVPPIIDQDHFTSRYEMFPMGHNRIVQMGRPSLRDRLPEGQPHPFDEQLRAWDIDPDGYPDFDTKAMQGWLDLKAAKRKLWKEKGFLHYENLSDEDLTESPFGVLFPNVAIAPGADSFLVWRWEPHPTDPEKCFFDQWTMAYPVEGMEGFVNRTARTTMELKEAELDFRVYGDGSSVQDLSDQVVFQDWKLTQGQRIGWRSRGYQEPYFAAQETRVHRFHEVLNDYLAGNPPGRD
jgi:phenylpropionate dioxygenase-like ring-hydroxylating dioxygenase large terminal subunit|tara:strand:- start:929 stop:2281 length:1353 start_codon:yes stop_codon:yes gene_type:complete